VIFLFILERDWLIQKYKKKSSLNLPAFFETPEVDFFDLNAVFAQK